MFTNINIFRNLMTVILVTMSILLGSHRLLAGAPPLEGLGADSAPSISQPFSQPVSNQPIALTTQVDSQVDSKEDFPHSDVPLIELKPILPSNDKGYLPSTRLKLKKALNTPNSPAGKLMYSAIKRTARVVGAPYVGATVAAKMHQDKFGVASSAIIGGVIGAHHAFTGGLTPKSSRGSYESLK